jgi:YD repeat-containing protein
LAFSAPNVLAGVTSYTYDALGRVTQALYPNGSQVNFQYDAAGNRIQTVRTDQNSTPPSSNIPPICNNWSITLNIPFPPYGTNTANINVPASSFLANCSDSDGGTLSIASPAMPLVTTVNRGQTLTFPFTASDGQGGTDGAVLTVIFP